MVKHIISIAAAGAVLTTGAMAFDAKRDGTIATETSTTIVVSSYTAATPAGTDLLSSTTQRGDALIYPAFNQKAGWGTDIIVRNTSEKAIVAKAVIYAADDSRELVDFNIYLSAKDSCRFTIKDGKITSSDGSIRTFGILPHQVDNTNKDLTDYRAIKFADTEALNLAMPKEAGYVAIYGMEQSDGISTDATDTGFHLKHADLYAAYAASLDDTTTGRGIAWRELTNTNGAMVKGMFVKGVTQAPPVVKDAIDVTFGPLGNKAKKATFTDVGEFLTGHVRIFNDAGRDTLLPAKALKNFTDENRILWTEGEYASIADRRIDGATYNATNIALDAASAFPATTATYTFANKSGSTDNTLLITQPYKRILSQVNLAGAEGYTEGAIDGDNVNTLATGTNFAFVIGKDARDEDEHAFEAGPAEIGGTIITSPRTSGSVTITPESFNDELQEIKPSDLDLDTAYNGTYSAKDGTIDVTIPVASIVTQMTATKAGSSDEINWVYSDITTN